MNGKEGQDVTSAVCTVTDPAESPSPLGCVSERRKSSEDIPVHPVAARCSGGWIFPLSFFPCLNFAHHLLAASRHLQDEVENIAKASLPLFLLLFPSFIHLEEELKGGEGERGQGGALPGSRTEEKLNPPRASALEASKY